MKISWRDVVLPVIVGGTIGLGVLGALSIASAPAPTAHKQSITEVLKILDPEVPVPRPVFATVQEAAIQGIKQAYVCSHFYECAGVIAINPDGKYVAGPVHTSYAGDGVTDRDGVPMGYKLVASYHTHPCLPDSHHVGYFSNTDTVDYYDNHITGFMGDLCTGEVHEFDIDTMKPGETQVEDGVWLTKGKIIGKIAVDGHSMEPNVG